MDETSGEAAHETPREVVDEVVPQAVPYSPAPGSPSITATSGAQGLALLVTFVAVALTVVVTVALVGASGADDPDPYDGQRSSNCAAEHDEDNSLFSDEEWCDLELNGGPGTLGP